MALTRPNLFTVPAFDATKEHVFEFSSQGGSAPITSNTLTIKRNDTLATVYSQTQTTFKYSHTLPAGTLTNGVNYVASIVAHDSQGNSSPESNSVQFWCYATPTFSISNMPASGVIGNSSFAFNVTYNQAQGESLNVYVFNLYNTAGTIVSTSGNQYNQATTLPITLSWLFSGFADQTAYSVEVVGQTTHGMQVTTGRIPFNVLYSTPQVFSTLFLTNNCKGGYVQIQSNVIGIPGETDRTPQFVNGSVDLRGGHYIGYKEGFDMNGDWTTRIWGSNFDDNSPIFELSTTDGDRLDMRYCTDASNAWIEMRVVSNMFQFGYTCQSNKIALPLSTDQLFIGLRRVGNIYQLTLENRGTIA